MEGLLLIDKPTGISSFGVVAKVRGIIKSVTGQRLKVGHSGTLDPAATGLLVLAIGAYTKKIPQLIKQDKTYEAELTLGLTSSTGDREGELTEINNKKPSVKEVECAIKQFEGLIEQTPPIYSAIKVNGVRAYHLARQNKPVELPKRQVTIYSLELLNYQYPKVSIRTRVSSGTYIRSLVEDIGKVLQTGAYTSSLRRLSIGEYQVATALSLADITYTQIEQSLIKLLKNE
jgi:tRNA pseudouridine55 synthase